MTGPVTDTAPTDLIQSVSRALRILEEVARSPRPLPVKVIARRQVEDELVRLRPGDLVREYGQFREQVCCAGMAIPGPRRDTWWALGASARGLSLPSPLLTELRLAATDLAASAETGT